MPAPNAKTWVVCKFGGTSVSYATSWAQIITRVRELQSGHRVCLVLSALSQVRRDGAKRGKRLRPAHPSTMTFP